MIAGEQTGSFAAKSAKDLIQAGLLPTHLKEFRTSEVDEARRDPVHRGDGWRSRAKRGVEALDKRFPELGVTPWLREESIRKGAPQRKRTRDARKN